MTSPVNVGQVSVEVIASAKALAKSLKKEVEAAFKGLDISKAIRDAVGKSPVKVPVQPDFDTDGLGEKVRKTRTPKVPVQLDPLLAAFQSEIKRQAAALAKQVNVSIPVGGDTSGLRAELGAELKAVADRLKIQVPTEPGDRATYEADLKAQLDGVSERVKAHVGADTTQIVDDVRTVKIPKVPVALDPVLAAFQAEVKRQTVALAKQVTLHIPVGGDTAGLRSELSAELAAIQAQSKIQVPTEPGAKAAYEAKLKTQLAEVARRLKVHIDADVDVDKSRVSALTGALSKVGLGGIADGFQRIASAASGAAGSAVQFGGSLAGAVSTAAGPVGVVVAGLAALAASIGVAAAAATFAVPAITALAGAVASLPGLMAGAGAGFATLSLGFSGISDAFKPKTGGGSKGGGAADDPAARARRIAGAERGVEAARRGIAAASRGLAAAERGLVAAEQGVTQAQERARLATVAVSKARQEATEDLDDLGRALRGAKLDEADAADAVTDALRALNIAREQGDLPEIEDAERAYRRALLEVENTKDATEDLTQAQKDAAKKGVNGSDKVQSALRDQRDAVQGVKDAQNGLLDAQNAVLSANDGVKASYDGLKSAQDSLVEAQKKAAAASAGGGALAQVVKLAPAARKFVDAIKSLKPAFEALRLSVQQKLFVGLDKTVKRLATAWLPTLREQLGAFATSFNGFFKDLGKSLGKPKFVEDIATAISAVRTAFDSIGAAVSGPLVAAFGALSRAAAPFIKEFGEQIAGVVTQFSDWVLQGEKTGGLTSFFSTATESMKQLFDIGGSVASIIGSVFEIIFGVGAGQNKKISPIENFRLALQGLADWLADPANQQKVADFFIKVENAAGKLQRAGLVVAGVITKVAGWISSFDKFKDAVVGVFTRVSATVTGFFGRLVDWFKALPGRIGGALKNLGTSVTGIFSRMATSAGKAVGYGIGVIARFFYLLPGRISAFIQSIPSRVSAIFNRIVDFARSLPGRVSAGVNGLGKLPGKIAGFFSGLKDRLFNVGADAIRGLWNGIKSLGGWLRDRVFDFAGGVVSGFRAGFDSHSPSRKMAKVGITLPQGLSVGLKSGEGKLLGDVRGLASNVVDAAALSPSVFDWEDLVAQPQAGALAPAALTGTFTADWAEGATSDPLLNGLRSKIKFSFRGDPVAALSS